MIHIQTIAVMMPFKLGSVNCYLVSAGPNYVLIDTGSANQRAYLDRELHSAGCKPGNLKLIVITHGDFDHTGNAAHLRRVFGAPVAMHRDDAGMAERGDMFVNRKQPNLLIRKLIPALSGFGKAERFTPDLLAGDQFEFSEYGLDARALSIPGHSMGSIGILTGCGELFCGDLFENLKKPALNSIMDNPAAANASVEMLKRLEITTVYPGHGGSFTMDEFAQASR